VQKFESRCGGQNKIWSIKNKSINILKEKEMQEQSRVKTE
jgi:hypothetical protein